MKTCHYLINLTKRMREGNEPHNGDNFTFTDLKRVEREVLLDAWCSGAQVNLGSYGTISIDSLIKGIINSTPSQAFNTYRFSGGLSHAYPLFSRCIPGLSERAFMDIFREAHVKRWMRGIERQYRRTQGRYVNARTMYQLRLARDIWAWRTWIKWRAPDFGLRIISGAVMGEPVTVDNGKPGKYRKIIYRFVGVQKVRNEKTGHVWIDMVIAR